MKRTVVLILLAGFMLSAGFVYTPQDGSYLAYSLEDVPKPRAPLLPRITSAQQLVPFAKIILQRDYIGQRLGWSIKGGEKVLLIVNNLLTYMYRPIGYYNCYTGFFAKHNCRQCPPHLLF